MSRKQRKTLSAVIHVASILSFFLLASGFGLALRDHLQPQQAPDPITKTKTNLAAMQHGGMLVGLGDSLTRGVGDSSGQGYFGMVRQQLQKEADSNFSSVNLAISGSTSSQLVSQLQQNRVKELIQSAEWITITIGGNDLFRGSGRLEKIDLQSAEKSRTVYEKNVTNILTELRKQNPNATIFIFGLYNPFGDLPDEKTTSRLVADWNQTIHKVSAQFDRVVVVPTFDLFQLEPNRYLYSDHFHPNQQGYRRMADRLLQIIKDHPKEAK